MVHFPIYIPNLVANDGAFDRTSAAALVEDAAISNHSTPVSVAKAISHDTTTASHAAEIAAHIHIVATVVIIIIDTSFVTVITVL